MRFATFIPLLVLLGATTAQARISDPLPWTVSTSREQCRLEANLSETTKVTFIASAGRKPVLSLQAPFRNRTSIKGELKIIPAPWQISQSRSVATTLRAPASELVFTSHIQQLLDAMANGEWGEIKLTSDEGDNWHKQIPATGISSSMTRFNGCRNNLPPLSFNDINDTKIVFNINATHVAIKESGKLDLVVDYLRYDDTIQAIQIDGHTDRSGKSYINLTLSRQRAEQVQKYLIDAGIPSNLFMPVRWHGSRDPINPGKTPEQRMRNRRVEIKLLRTDPRTISPTLNWS